MEQNSITIEEPVREHVVGRFHATLLPRMPYEVRYKTDTPVIGFAFEAQQGIHSFASDNKSDFKARPNSLAYLPAEYDVYSYSPYGGEYLTIKIDDADDCFGICQRRFNNVIDLTSVVASENIRRLLISKSSFDLLELESNILLLQNQVIQDVKPSNASGWLTPYRLRIIDEIVEDNLDNNLTVQFLSDALGLSTGFFTRAFKASMGKSPHSYTIDRRIYHARALLRKKEVDLSAIALACGFSSHSHMTTAFKQRLGITPSVIVNQ